MVRRQVAVIVTFANGSLATKAATTTIPIVFIVGRRPGQGWFVASLARPGGNLTGINLLSASWWQNGWNSCVSWYRGPPRFRACQPDGPHFRDNVERCAVGCSRHRAGNPGPQRRLQRRDQCGFHNFTRERPGVLFVDIAPFFTTRRVQLVHLASHQGSPPRMRCANSLKSVG